MLLKSLSARLLVLTIFFVMVSEVLIFVPSVARFRMTYFENLLAAGHIAIMAVEASATGELQQGLTDKLLAQVGARGVALHRRDGTVLRLDSSNPPQPDVTINLTHPDILLAITLGMSVYAWRMRSRVDRSELSAANSLPVAPPVSGATVTSQSRNGTRTPSSNTLTR